MGCCFRRPHGAQKLSDGDAQGQEQLHKQYLLDTKMLGSGSYAKVYKAREIKTGKVVAVKRIDKAHSRRELLDAEITIMRRFNRHKNVVGLFAVYETAEEMQLVLEFMAGGELFDALDANGPYGEACAAKHLRDMSSALEYLHNNRVAHRDLKPENLLLSSKPPSPSMLKISDFGLAAILQEQELFSTACGTWAYCAPEVLRCKADSAGRYDYRCDMFSVGVLLFVILAAYHPFDVDGQNTDLVMQELIMQGRWDFEDVAWDEVSDEAKDLITLCLSPDVNKRPSATQVLQHVWTSSMCKYGSLSMKIDSDLKSYSLRMKQKRLKGAINAAKAAARMDIMATRTKQECGDKRARAQEHWSVVKDAIKKRRLWKDGTYPKSAALKLTHNRFLRLQNSPDIADVYRQERIDRIFKSLDRDGNSWLSEQELYPFACHTGLVNTEIEWKVEFRKLCKECGWDTMVGIDSKTFQLALSTKEFIFFSADATLRHLLLELQGERERGESVGKIEMDFGPNVSLPLCRLQSEPVIRAKTPKASGTKSAKVGKKSGKSKKGEIGQRSEGVGRFNAAGSLLETSNKDHIAATMTLPLSGNRVDISVPTPEASPTASPKHGAKATKKAKDPGRSKTKQQVQEPVTGDYPSQS